MTMVTMSKAQEDLIKSFNKPAPKQFKARLRLKEEMWLGCKVSGYSNEQRVPGIKFSNCPWILYPIRWEWYTLYNRFIIAYGHTPQSIFDVFPLDSLWHLKVKAVAHPHNPGASVAEVRLVL